jgi:preprotein translocase subunit SecF
MIDFLKYRTLFAFISALLIGGFIGLFFYKKQVRGYAFNYSVDFTGGTQILFKFGKPVTDTQIRDILEKHGWAGALMRDFGPDEILIRLKEVEEDVRGLSEKIQNVLKEELQTEVNVLSVDSVSGGIGAVLRWQSFRAILLSLLLMLLYIWFRFWSFSFGIGAVVSLAHDAIAILLVFLLFDKEISIPVIGAVLTILGYSINDTIVVLTRIRRNLATMKQASMEHLVNLSINQTLRRTLLTSFATTLVVIALFVLGGESLRDLSLALLVGMVFGTYSSIYIASSVMLLLHKKG